MQSHHGLSGNPVASWLNQANRAEFRSPPFYTPVAMRQVENQGRESTYGRIGYGIDQSHRLEIDVSLSVSVTCKTDCRVERGGSRLFSPPADAAEDLFQRLTQ